VWWAAKGPRVQVGGARGGGAGAGEDDEEGGAAAAGVARARLVSAMAKKHLVRARRARLKSDSTDTLACRLCNINDTAHLL